MRNIVLLLLLFLPLDAGQVAAAAHGRVSWVYDGDTIEVEQVGRVRLLGIDVPEHRASARDRFFQRRFQIGQPTLRAVARQATRFVIEHSRDRIVRLEFDHEQKDQYGRLLAYVYLPDGRLLNLMLIDEGLATVFQRAEFRRKKQFSTAQEAAQQRRVGLWKDYPPTR